MPIYLDANGTEPVREGALAAMVAAARETGNPASVHAQGRQTRRVLEEARGAIGKTFGLDSDQVIFTSGGTEADALAIHAFRPGRRVLVGATEHDAVRKAVPDAMILPVLPDGTLCLESLERTLSESGPALVCAMSANNETGVLHPIGAIAALCAKADAWLHVDAVQQAGRMTLDMRTLGANSMAISGHKFGGPKGAGALLLRRPGTVAPMIEGGGQERGRRGGTPALPAIAGMAAALEDALAQDWTPIALWRDQIEEAAREAGARIAGDGTRRLPNTTTLVLDGVPAQTQLMTLDLAGIAVSAGSACSSGKVTPSHVLTAMGYGPAAGQAIRVSLPWNATEESVERFVAVYGTMAARMRERCA